MRSEQRSSRPRKSNSAPACRPIRQLRHVCPSTTTRPACPCDENWRVRRATAIRQTNCHPTSRSDTQRDRVSPGGRNLARVGGAGIIRPRGHVRRGQVPPTSVRTSRFRLPPAYLRDDDSQQGRPRASPDARQDRCAPVRMKPASAPRSHVQTSGKRPLRMCDCFIQVPFGATSSRPTAPKPRSRHPTKCVDLASTREYPAVTTQSGARHLFFRCPRRSAVGETRPVASRDGSPPAR